MIDFSKVGLFIRELRTFKAWPQAQLAEISGLSERTIQRLEKGEECSFETLRSIGCAFGIDVQLLVSLGSFNVDSLNYDSSGSVPCILTSIETGNELAKFIAGTESHLTQFDQPENTEECEAIKDLGSRLVKPHKKWLKARNDDEKIDFSPFSNFESGIEGDFKVVCRGSGSDSDCKINRFE